MAFLTRGIFVFMLGLFPLSAGASAGEPNPQAWLQELSQKAGTELSGNILPYWLKYARNPATGGFHGEVDQKNRPRPDTVRGSLLTARILWTFSAAYRHDPRPEYKEMADYAYRDLQDHFFDQEHGGYFWSIEADGRPKITLKQIYTQVFCLYGLSEYTRAFGSETARAAAAALYSKIDAHAFDPVHGGYFETCARDWSREKAPRSLIGPRAPKSQNTNLHVLEALTTWYRVQPDPALKERLISLIRVMATKVLDPRTHHLSLFQKDDWTPVGDEYSYGHDIEFSWLLVEAAEAAGDEALLAEMKKVAVAVVDTTVREGMDPDGSILGEGGPHGVVNRYKEWWAQAEAVVGFVNAYEITRDPVYLQHARRTWTVIEEHLIDRRGGEWFLFVTEEKARLARTPKISFWKCPYHNGRACLEVMERAKRIQ